MKEQILPVALRDNEITEADVETMLKIALDKDTPLGRIKRTPKRIPESLCVPPDIINDSSNPQSNYSSTKIADKKGVC